MEADRDLDDGLFNVKHVRDDDLVISNINLVATSSSSFPFPAAVGTRKRARKLA
jgi:hypothetical protein